MTDRFSQRVLATAHHQAVACRPDSWPRWVVRRRIAVSEFPPSSLWWDETERSDEEVAADWLDELTLLDPLPKHFYLVKAEEGSSYLSNRLEEEVASTRCLLQELKYDVRVSAVPPFDRVIDADARAVVSAVKRLRGPAVVICRSPWALQNCFEA